MIVKKLTERQLMVEYFKEFLQASLSKEGAKEGLLSCCYKDDMIPQCHPEEPSNDELIELICNDALQMNSANMYELSQNGFICDISNEDEKYDYPQL